MARSQRGFQGPIDESYLLVVTDDYSRYPVVDIVHSTSSKVVIPGLDKIFAEFGIPHVVKTDNDHLMALILKFSLKRWVSGTGKKSHYGHVQTEESNGLCDRFIQDDKHRYNLRQVVERRAVQASTQLQNHAS